MDYGALPPEINSARMYTGPGSGSMLAAAAGWDALAAELRSAAASYTSVISGLATAWLGPSSTNMALAAAPYAAWLNSTATQAEQTANQARSAVSAYDAAFAATVPPPVIEANRAELASLISANTLGQNTAAIAANEARYATMWARDSAAMYGYAGQSAAASAVTPFDPPSQTTNPAGTAAQTAAVTQAVGANTQSTLSQLTSATPSALQMLAAPAAANPPSSISSLPGLLSSLDSSPLATIAGDVELIPKVVLPANDVLISNIMGLVFAVGHTTSAIKAITGSGLAAGLASTTSLATGSAVSASVGQAGLVGGLAVPPSWAVATPAIQTVAAVLSDTSQSAISTAAVTEGSFLSGMAVSGLAGAALGTALPRSMFGTSVRRPSTASKDGQSLKDSASPDTLQRVVADMAQNPDSVQHWHTDPDNLDGLLAELRKKPGTHTVHVKNSPPKVTLPNP